MPSAIPRLYWDSCAWIGLLNGEPAKKHELEIVYSEARQGQYELWTSTMSVVEVNRVEAEMQQSKPLSPASISTIDTLLFQRFIKLVPMDIPVAKLARKLVRETPGLTKKADAIHLATALQWNVPTLHTYDKSDLLHLDGKLRCRDGTVLSICVPNVSSDLLGRGAGGAG